MSETLNLLDLPDATLSTILSGLAELDKKSFMAACRRTLHMATQNTNTTLRVTRGTKFAGIKQVLDSLQAQIHLQIMEEDEGDSSHDMPLSAVSVLMGMVPHYYLTQTAATCRWDCITKGRSIRCLIPQFIALACPHLQHLKVMPGNDQKLAEFTERPEDALPITPCSSLKQLELDIIGDSAGYHVWDWERRTRHGTFLLPPSHHSPVELQHNLPNIDTLIFPRLPNVALIQAFASQLTRLEIYSKETEVLQAVCMCTNIRHLSTNNMLLPYNTAALKFLELADGVCSDDDLKELLKMPSVNTLRVRRIRNIECDWRNHPCSWQELHISSLEFTTLANLNFSSIKKLSTGPAAIIKLPDPSNLGSMAAVQRAAANLQRVGKVTVAADSTDSALQYPSVHWDVPRSNKNHDQEAAEMLAIAAKLVGPAKGCLVAHLLDRQLVLISILNWGQTFIEAVMLGECRELQPHVWQALQQLQKLEAVQFHSVHFHPGEDIRGSHETLPLFRRITAMVSNAAQHYVVPANKSLRMQGTVALLAVITDEEFMNLETDGSQYLSATIADVLPAGSELVSVDFCDFMNNDSFRWIVVVAPT